MSENSVRKPFGGVNAARARWPLRSDPVIFDAQRERPRARNGPRRVGHRRSALARLDGEENRVGPENGTGAATAGWTHRLPAHRGLDRLSRHPDRAALALPRHRPRHPQADARDDRVPGAPGPLGRALAVREGEDPDLRDLSRGHALEERRARGPRARAHDLAPGGGAGPEARACGSSAPSARWRPTWDSSAPWSASSAPSTTWRCTGPAASRSWRPASPRR